MKITPKCIYFVYNLVNVEDKEDKENEGHTTNSNNITNGNITKLLVWIICKLFLNCDDAQPVKHLKIVNREHKCFSMRCMI